VSLKLGHKIFLLVSVPLLFILVAIALFALAQQRSVAADAAADHSNAVLAQSAMLWERTLDAEDNARGYILTRDPIYLERFHRSASQMPLLSRDLEQLVIDNPPQASKADALGITEADQLRYLETSIASVHARTRSQSERIKTLAGGSRAMDALQSQLTTFDNEELRLQSVRDATMARSLDSFNALLVLSTIVAFVLSLLIMQTFSRILVRRLAALGDDAQAFADGGPFGTSASNGSDEISLLHHSFNEMSESMAEKQTVLARYQLMVKSARDVILFVSCDDLRIIDANDAALNAYGYDRAELLAMTIRDLRTPDSHAIHDYELKNADAGHTLFESRHRRKDGSTFPVEVAGSSAEIDGHRVLLTVVRDVSERKRAENEHEKFFDRSNDLMGVANAEGIFSRINVAWQYALGYTIEELTNKPFLQLVHPDDRRRAESVLAGLNRGNAISSFENRFVRNNGSFVWLAWSAIPSLDEGLIYIVARDVTKRKEIESELALSRDQAMEASLLKSQFLANMSHEIRTPMNGIVATSELLLRSRLDDEEREYAGIISESAHALLKIINQILDLSKLEASKLELESAEFSSLTVAESVTELLKVQAAQKKLSLHTFVAESVPQIVRGDAGRLRQILLNLMGNALKFTERGAVSLRVSVQADEASHVTLRFAVADTGIGLSPSTRERLFEPFIQADGSNSRKFDGTGLGLSISKRLVELMHGEIGVESEIGVGSTFWFTARFAKAGAAAQHGQDPPLRGRRMLIVDSEPTSRDVFAQYARSWGIRSAATSDATDVMTLLREGVDSGDPFHFLIVDLMTADVDAWRVSAQIAADASLSATKLILATTLDAYERVQTSDNFAAILSKPVRQSQLLDCLLTATDSVRPKPVASEKDAPVVPKLAVGQIAIAGSGSARILLAEDHAINRRIAIAQLKELGLKADLATNGREAIDAYERNRYDIILMDCQMPEVDGFAATRAIRAIQARDGGDVRIVAMTANAMEGDRRACIEAGMDDYLSKPVELDRLRDALLPNQSQSGTTMASHEGRSSRFIREPCVLDSGRLRQVFRGDAGAIREALELTMAECRPLASTLQSAIVGMESDVATHAAHKLKGICGNVGATELATIGTYIERAVKSADWPGAQVACNELEAALNRLEAAASAGESPLRTAL
jgi:two-component system sensor histidine kinase/response regulator